MKIVRLLLLFSVVVCCPWSARAQDACIPAPIAHTPFEAYFIQSSNVLFEQVRPMGASVGDQMDFCFTTGIGNTYFYARPDLRRSGIRLSIDHLNSLYAFSPGPDYAFLANLQILLHEMGHLTAHYLNRTNTLVMLGTGPAHQFPVAMGMRMRNSPQQLAQMQWAIATPSMASEAFADCFSGFLLQNAIQSTLENLRTSLDPNANMMAQHLASAYLPTSMQVVLRTVTQAADRVENRDRVHGTVAERLSFVLYGMNAAQFYGASVYNSSRANAVLGLCAVNAYEMQLRHTDGRETPFPPFNLGF